MLFGLHRRHNGRWGVALALALGVALPHGVGAVPAARPAASEYVDAVTRHLRVFLTVPERREAGEGVFLDDDGELEIRFLRTLGAERREAWLCQGLRWLLIGRLAHLDGAAGLFRDFPGVSAVTLVFYRLDTSLSVDASGGYVQARGRRAEARLSLSREVGLGLDAARLREMLGPGRCIEEGSKLVRIEGGLE